ncbi:MAG TPA: MlaD family protein [Planctomycetota bacterium]|nr:MlaD family protein [Planctomycetota bacterium]
MNKGKEIVVGAVFVLAILLLGIFTIIVSDYVPFRPKIQWQIRFDDVRGLKAGDEVRASGVQVGKVQKIELVNGKVTVAVRLYKELPFYKNGEITIESVSPLGGKYINIETGDLGAGKADVNKLLYGTRPPEDITSAINKFMREIREGPGTLPRLLRDDEVYNNIKEVSEALRTVATDIKEHRGLAGKLLGPESDKIYGDLEAIVASVREATTQISQKKGTLGRIIYDEALYDQVLAGVAAVQGILADARAGKGTIGKLLTDDELFNHVKEIAASIKDGKGLIGKLVTDEKMAKDAQDALSQLGIVADKLNRGEGTLGMLITDKRLYDDAAAFMASLKNAAAKIESGEGTIGKLISDPMLYAKIDKLVTELTQAVEDAREAAPITAFSTLLLAGFR